jgi:excinuclease UvrABC nuclease subunit
LEKENIYSNLRKIVETLISNVNRFEDITSVSLIQAKPPKKPGVYMVFFEEKLQYIGSSTNLHERIRTNLVSGDRQAHTLINKLCKLKNWTETETHAFLKDNSTIKFVDTASEDDAKILEDVLIAVHHPFYNTPLRKMQIAE